MLRRIVFFVLAMVFCLTTAGCAQNTNNQDAGGSQVTTNSSNRQNENADSDVSTIMDETNNLEEADTQSDNDESVSYDATEETIEVLNDGYIRVENDFFSYEIPSAAVDGKKYRQQPFTDRDYYIIPFEESNGSHDPYTAMAIYVPAKIAFLYEMDTADLDPSKLASLEYNNWLNTGYSDGKDLFQYTVTIDGQTASVVEVNKAGKDIFYFFNTPNGNLIMVQMTADEEYYDAIKDRFIESIKFVT